MHKDELRAVLVHFMAMADSALEPSSRPGPAESVELTAVRYFMAGLKAGEALPDAEINEWQRKLDTLEEHKLAEWQHDRAERGGEAGDAPVRSPDADRARFVLRSELRRVKAAHDAGAGAGLARQFAAIQGMTRGFRRVGLIDHAEYLEWEYALTEAVGALSPQESIGSSSAGA